MTDAVFLSSGQGETIAMGPNQVRVLAEADGYAMAEGTFPPGGPAPPRHRHDWDEAFYVTGGRLEVTVGDEATVAWPGDFVLVPGGTPHTLRAVGDEPASFFGYFASGGGVRYIRELSTAFPASGPPDEVALAEIQARFGVEVV